ncbi:TnsA endonuclease N-terminal domain-containing protein [Geoalkalibacter halelectricus]|uniref:TnsA endonuclease N-terminal domain-containing protein n=1 Tax=Geoalkalibacter halelectricus TaxID=2847045 RepID=A0ABY5ZQQ3_9BACT|nr:TnsA endonuclease N-terminal domain-containing protein [Geoalkalibacter halelectricus]MDO3377719.1 TnsA endonuclease N-terminal domain-containing protein [Geoalkalibacter halelectricus]UWZ81507.1 TnsA endonuclease N-terminal domain-containing protein [Geoalkalibacter halelectricus]
MKDFLLPHPKPIVELLEPAILKKLVKEKRGQGLGKNYKPFLTVRDVPSKGRVHRRPSITHSRIVHLLSDLELAAFLLFDWHPSIIDIREQFPLDPEKTLNIAKRLGIKHPAVKGVYQVMTTDLLLDINLEGKIISQAVSVKYRSDLEDERIVEKQEIERRYWEGEQIEWYLFTENEVPTTLVQNIKWLIPHLYSFDLDKSSQIKSFNLVLKAIETFPEDKISVVMKGLDERQGDEPGTHLAYLRHLLAQNAFTWDMARINHRSLRTRDLIPSEHWQTEGYEYVYAQ